MNPYLIQGPSQISFSGGRSSAMMLCKIVEAHGGTLPDDVIVQFANTGKEREETLAFVQRVAEHLDVLVQWVEYCPAAPGRKWADVSFYDAARNGEPFAAMVKPRQYLPNPVARLCTQSLKVEPMRDALKARGIPDYVCVSGIRADEPRRVAKMRARKDVEFVLPLADAGVTQADVLAFWKAMPFDLEMDAPSNCDLCFLRGVHQLLGVIRKEPHLADWWIAQEADGKMFRSDRPNYAALKVIATQPQLFDLEEQEDAQPCECTD